MVELSEVMDHVGKCKVHLNPMYRIVLNFATSYILSCLSNFYNKKKIEVLKAEIKGVFSRS